MGRGSLRTESGPERSGQEEWKERWSVKRQERWEEGVCELNPAWERWSGGLVGGVGEESLRTEFGLEEVVRKR